MPISTGTVISRSTSSAAWPGHWVMISTIARRQIGIGVHRQALQRPRAGADQHQRHHADEKALPQRRGHDPVHDRRRARRRSGGAVVAHWFCMNWTNNPPSTTIRSPALRPAGDVIMVPGAIAQRHAAAARSRHCFRTTYTKGRFSSSRSIAETGTSRPVLSCAGVDPHADIHLLPQQAARIVDRHAHLHRTGVGIDQAGMLVTVPESVRRDACHHLGMIAEPTEAMSESNTCAITQMRETSAMVKHGVLPACSNCPGVISLSTSVPAIGERMMPWICDSVRPALDRLDVLRIDV